MKKVTFLVVILLVVIAVPDARAGSSCSTIKDGVLTYSDGHYLAAQPLQTGYDDWGYNYQAHLFNGSYANVYLGGDGFPPYYGDDTTYLASLSDEDQTAVQAKWYWPYRSTTLNMKWNDAWLSNKDCDGDGKLDRHYGFDSYIGSGAWETNHQLDSYELDSQTIHWSYFVKIVAVPEDATPTGGIWYTADGAEIGPDIWGQFATIQEVYNDPGTSAHGLSYKSPASPGFGFYQP